MSSGVIVQEGGPRDIYLQPKSKFVANFIGSTNQLNGQVSKTDADGTGTVRTDAGEISRGLLAGLDQEPMSSCVVVRPESVVLHRKTRATGKHS